MSRENKDEAISSIDDSTGFLLLSTSELDEDTVELSVVVEEMSASDLGQGIDWILQNYPEVINYTIFGAGKIEDKPVLTKMN